MNQMQCEQVNDLLSAYVDNEVDTVTAMKIAQHLERCQACRHEFQLTKQVSDVLKTAVKGAPDLEPALEVRAFQLNNRVHGLLTAQLGKPKPPISGEIPRLEAEAVPPPDELPAIVVALKPKWTVGRVARTILAIAASLVVMVGLGYGSFLYWLEHSGSFSVAIARDYRVCNGNPALVAWYRDGHPAPDPAPIDAVGRKLKQMGYAPDGLALCKIGGVPFVHTFYMRDNQPLSVYFGPKQAVAFLKSEQGDAKPGQVYEAQKDTIAMSAFVSANEEHVWVVAGELPRTQINDITHNLMSETLAKKE
ncbi:MAG: zf-HC2 domain-containing protein [Acidobacteria bacterium]|nr:zf-HC2 domain-containing protein [Acidobacteriota bacterium]